MKGQEHENFYNATQRGDASSIAPTRNLPDSANQVTAFSSSNCFSPIGSHRKLRQYQMAVAELVPLVALSQCYTIRRL